MENTDQTNDQAAGRPPDASDSPPPDEIPASEGEESTNGTFPVAIVNGDPADTARDTDERASPPVPMNNIINDDAPVLPAVAEHMAGMERVMGGWREAAGADAAQGRGRACRVCTDIEIAIFNEQNCPVKRFLDVVLGASHHNPLVDVVRRALLLLRTIIHVDEKGMDMNLTNREIGEILASTESLNFAEGAKRAKVIKKMLKDANDAKKTLNASQEKRAKVSDRDARKLFESLGKYINAALLVISGFPLDSSLIYMRMAQMPNGSEMRVSTVFREILTFLDVTYKRTLRDLPEDDLLVNSVVDLDNYPNFGSLLNNMPHEDGGYPLRPPPPHTTRPSPVRLETDQNSKNFRLCHDSTLTNGTPLFQKKAAHKLFQLMRNNGGVFELRSDTGSGKTLVVPTLMTAIGTTLLVQLNDFHVHKTASILKKFGFECRVLTCEYAKYGHLPKEVRAPIFRPRNPSEEASCQKMREMTIYEPMRSNNDRVLNICTYETCRHLLRHMDYPDILILDDVRSKSIQKDLVMYGLMYDAMAPEGLRVCGLSTSELDNGIFSFTALGERRNGITLVNEPIPAPFPISSIGINRGRLLFASTKDAIRRITDTPADARDLLLAAGKPELLHIITSQLNLKLMNDYLREVERLPVHGFIDWIKASFIPHFQDIDGFLRVISYLAVMPMSTIDDQEHSRLLDESEIRDALKFYRQSLKNGGGAVILFLPSQEAVSIYNKALRTQDIDLLPIIGPDSEEEINIAQSDLVVDDDGNTRPRIILLSPESEACVTFPHVSYVIDTKLKYVELVSTKKGIYFNLTISTNAQEIEQRRGRTGRTTDGAYLPLHPRLAPDQIPSCFNNNVDTDQLEMRTMLLETLALCDSRGGQLTRAEIAERLREWFPDLNESLTEASLEIMEKDGICSTDPYGNIFLTRIGRLVAEFPGSYDENFLAATGALFGCFRSMVAYIVGRFSVDNLWKGDLPRERAWRDFFNWSVPEIGASHLDYVLAVMYWHLKSEHDVLACYRANVLPSVLQGLRWKMRRFEVALYACMYQLDLQSSLDPMQNDHDLFVRRMALIAGTHGNVAMADAQGHGTVLSTGNSFTLKAHNEESCPDPYQCNIDSPVNFDIFSRIRVDGQGDDEIFGDTYCGIFLPSLFFDVTQPGLEDSQYEGVLILRTHLEIIGPVEEIMKIRKCISDLVASFLAGNNNAQGKLCEYLKRISVFLKETLTGNPDFKSWRSTEIPDSCPIPPAGLGHRRQWCVGCLFQGHTKDECLGNTKESLRRYNDAAFYVPYDIETPVLERIVDCKLKGFNYTKDKAGKERKCKNCGNIFHAPVDCRSKVRADGCFRCKDRNNRHKHTRCPHPSVCDHCQINIHSSDRCIEDLLLIDQVFHMSVANFIKRILMASTRVILWTEEMLSNLRLPRLTNDYYILPRDNLNSSDTERNFIDPTGPDRHPFEPRWKDFM